MKLPVIYDNMSVYERRSVREEYIKLQGGKCYHCGSPLSGPPSSEIRSTKINESLFPPGFFNFPVHLHHSHDSGLTLGAVHNKCNAVLWQYHGE